MLDLVSHRAARSLAGVAIRPIRPDDAGRLQMFHRRLSDDTIRNRFFGPHPELAKAEAQRLTTLSPGAEVALVATVGSDIVGVGRFVRLGVSDAAEVAFVIQDGYQGRGLGTALLTRLAGMARTHGIDRFTADTWATNGPMLDVFLHTPHAVAVTSTHRDGSVVHLTMSVAATAPRVGTPQCAAGQTGVQAADTRRDRGWEHRRRNMHVTVMHHQRSVASTTALSQRRRA